MLFLWSILTATLLLLVNGVVCDYHRADNTFDLLKKLHLRKLR